MNIVLDESITDVWHRDGLAEALARQLGLEPDALAGRASLLQLGLDSLDVLGWAHRFQEAGLDVRVPDLYRRPTLEGWLALAGDRAPDRNVSTPCPAADVWPPAQPGQPFALTPVQHAYLVGRSRSQPLGGVGCHLYQEFDGSGITPQDLERAVFQVFQRHPMLRARFRPEGVQEIHETPNWKGLTVHDLRTMAPDARHAALEEVRSRLGHRLPDVEQGDVLDVHLALLPDGAHRIFTSVDLLVADAAGYARVHEDLSAILRGETLPPVPQDYDFSSYLAQREALASGRREEDRSFWMKRLDTLPDAPSLPLAREPGTLETVRITRRRVDIEPGPWQQFCEQARRRDLTPTMALATAFSAILGRWTGQSRLLLNLTLFDRQPLHPAVGNMVADFTNVVLMDMNCAPGSLTERGQENQHTFAECREHCGFSGVEVMRELRRSGSHPHGAPVVFTGNLNSPLISTPVEDTLGRAGWGISQTPQVWIDHMAVRQGERVVLQWDCNDALFPAGLTDDLFEAYTDLVHRLGTSADAWEESAPDLLPEPQLATRRKANATAAPVPSGCLHDAVFARATENPGEPAVLDTSLVWTRGELAARACGLAAGLEALGLEPGGRVGICMPRGAGQVAAALGILHAGGTYVPVGADQPAERIRRICEDAGLAALVVCADDPEHLRHGGDIPRLVWQAVDPVVPSDPVPTDPDQPAYVIYTSGSTGAPKGVVVSHRAALNTCVDLNRRYAVQQGDRVLALSALHFDLSVYDIFGVLGAGGGLVLVAEDERRDPEVWCRRIERDQVTLWNTVPALFDMLLTYAEGCGETAPEHLRLVFLSGDWVGLDLPARYRDFRPDGRFVAMGGATEAAIWSNALDVDTVPGHWTSIPYGYPLASQSYRVVDPFGRDCPAWCPGELWIGGAGVALGYFNDPERTADRFVETPEGRWYRTGDLGRYWPDGMLEFLGRRDKQVKVGGYRIELGEIDAAFTRLEGVTGAVTLATGDKDKRLRAFVTLRPGAFCRTLHADPALPLSYRDAFDGVESAPGTGFGETEIAFFLLEFLTRNGVDLTFFQSRDAVGDACGCTCATRSLLSDWLDFLGEQGLLEERDGSWRSLLDGPEMTPTGDRPPARVSPEPLQRHQATLAAIVQGHADPLVLLDDPFWSPEQVALRLRGAAVFPARLAALVRDLAPRLGRPVRIVEYGARTGVAAQAVLEHLGDTPVDYLALDESPDRVQSARERFRSWPGARVERLDGPALARHGRSADIVWANNALHRAADPAQALRDALSLAAPGAAILILEATSLPAEARVSTEVLRHTGRRPTDLVDSVVWREGILAAGATLEACHTCPGLEILVARAPRALDIPDSETLRAALATQVPDYMIPRPIRILEALPLTPNGKVDMATLRALAEDGDEATETRTGPETAAEKTLAGLWSRFLDCGPVHRESDFFRLGGDSLLATRLVGALAREGYQARLEDVFGKPLLADLAATLRPVEIQESRALTPDPVARHDPFPLTDIQQAYLVGREPGFALGGVPAHYLVIFEARPLDFERFRSAWDRLIRQHDMLRAVIENGRQRVLEHVPSLEIPRHRFSRLDSPQVRMLEDRLAGEVRDPGVWPLFAVHVIEADDTDTRRILIDIDNLFLDGMSMQILFSELKALYQDPRHPLPPLDMSFRDYVLHTGETPVPQATLDHWEKRLESLPGAPDLPLACSPADLSCPRFCRLEDTLPAPLRSRLLHTAAERGLTPPVLLLAAYAGTISAWSASPDITLNLTVFDRQPVHRDVDRVLGDFTSLLLASWEPAGTWLETALAMQERLREDMAHRGVSAIRVMRDLARRSGVASVSMPVVFTSALGYDRDEGFLSRRSWLTPVGGISRTPQTWIDFQVYEADNQLFYNWDVAEDLFDPGLVRAMFRCFHSFLHRLASEPEAWDMDLETLLPRQVVGRMNDNGPAPAARTGASPAEPAAGREDGRRVALIQDFFRQGPGLEIAPGCNFFDAGATSLNLVQLHAFLGRNGYPALGITDLFLHASPAALARHLGASAPAESQTTPDTDPGHRGAPPLADAEDAVLRRRRRKRPARAL